MLANFPGLKEIFFDDDTFTDDLPRAEAIVAAVSHREYAALSVADIGSKLVAGGAFIDVKAAFDATALQGAGFRVWRL